MKKGRFWKAGLFALGCAGALGAQCEALRGYATARADKLLSPPPESKGWTDAQWGAFDVLNGDFGTLTTDNLASNAVPWKLVWALADVVPDAFCPDRACPPGAPLRRFGIIDGAKVAGPPVLVEVARLDDTPVGYARGTARRSAPDLTVELASVNCSMCHLGRGWDEKGQPTGQLWWGIPNHSVDFDALAAAIVASLQSPSATDPALMTAMRQRFPELSAAEEKTYRKYLLPGYRKGIAQALAHWGGVHPWHFGGPGFSHGAAIVRESLAGDRFALKPAEFPPAYTKIPNVFGVTAKERILVDGSYVSRPVTSAADRFRNHLIGFLPVLGASVDRAIAEEPRLVKVRAFLEVLTPPPFPKAVDPEKVARGKALYGRRCAECHGDLDAEGHYTYPNRLFSVEAIGTDPTRARAIDAKLAAKFSATAIGKYVTVVATGSYAPPLLRGVWVNAPYFHNGSVPTLWHVLKPEERPLEFDVGGHALDLEKVGIAPAAPGYRPWSQPKRYDTREPGRSNRGHETQVAGLSDPERWDLIEYLKTL